MTRPTISAVMPNYNHAQYLPQVLASLKAQTVPFDEVLIIDDGSTDTSVDIIERMLPEIPNARLIRNPQNLGLMKTVENTLTQAQGDFIFYMAADDHYSPQVCEYAIDALTRFPDVAMVSGNTCFFEDSNPSNRLPLQLPFPQVTARYTAADLLQVASRQYVTFFGGANIIRKQAIIDVGGQLPELRWHADWMLYLILANRYPFAVVPLEMIAMRRVMGRYSEACYDWKRQKPVIEAYLRVIHEVYPDALPYFRRCAVMPTYDIQSLWLLLSSARGRRFLTPVLVWRLLVYKLGRRVGRLLPMPLIARLRPLLRI